MTKLITYAEDFDVGNILRCKKVYTPNSFELYVRMVCSRWFIFIHVVIIELFSKAKPLEKKKVTTHRLVLKGG